jgi:molybdopterin-guanine dinucleotide biosynthesis protein A
VAVLVLTGGLSTRMGAHKPALEVGGVPIVARVIGAAQPRPTLVVGRPEGVPSGIPVVGEHPPLGGPVAAVAAGLDALTSSQYAAGPSPLAPDVVVVLGGDLPFVTSRHLDRLVTALRADPRAAAAVTAGRGDRLNWLCAAWRIAALRERCAALGDPRHRSMRSLADHAPITTVSDEHALANDVDTPADLEAARRRAESE